MDVEFDAECVLEDLSMFVGHADAELSGERDGRQRDLFAVRSRRRVRAREEPLPSKEDLHMKEKRIRNKVEETRWR